MQRFLSVTLVWLCSSPVQASEPTPSAVPKPQYQSESIRVEAARADEPLAQSLSAQKAAEYLDQGAWAWSASKKCVSCHTNGVYLTVRPALANRLGEPEPKFREFFVEILKQKLATDRNKLAKGTLPEQVIFVAAGLAEWDRHVTGRLSSETAEALKLMLAIQGESGTWDAKDCWPPYESDSYQPATLAAMALATAPGWLDQLSDEPQKAAVAKLKKYLATTEPPHDYGRIVLLWADSRMPGLITSDQRASILKMLIGKQQADGGWSIRTFATPQQWGSGNRAARLKAEPDSANPASDGHMTGLALVVLNECGVPKSDRAVQAGLAWLKKNQRASGRWWTRSLNTDNYHFITFSGTAYPLLALSRYDEWPAPSTAGAAATSDRPQIANQP